MEEKKNVLFDVVKGTLPKEQKIHYEWEQNKKRGLEPWHFSTASLILDLLILIMYLFVDQWVTLQIPLGYTGLLLSVTSIIISYLLLKRKTWSMGTMRYTRLMNGIAMGVTTAMIFLTVLLSS